MKKFLEDLLARQKQKLEDLKKRNEAAKTIDEVRSIGNEIVVLQDEIRSTESQLAALPKEERSLNPIASYGQVTNPATTEKRDNEDPLATMEYRTAFMNYVTRGEKNSVLTAQMQTRAADRNVASDLGVLLPTTVIQSIMTDLEKVYGQLYSRVRKTNIKGGVKYPIGSFSAEFRRITETTVSERQKGGSVTGYVEFSYKIGEIRLAKTLLESVLEVPAFEAELSKVIVKAYVEAMDKEIMTGVDDNNEMVGILTEANKTTGSRIKADHIIEFTAEEMADWTKWQEKLFAVIPLSMRGLRPEFAMTAHTYEANIKTLKDDNNRPVYNETFNPVDGTEIATFKGRQVVFVEEDILKNFNDAANGEYFGMYWVPNEAYAINTNLEFYVKRYFDDDTNEWVDKAIMINDGKVLNPNYLYLLKKKVSA